MKRKVAGLAIIAVLLCLTMVWGCGSPAPELEESPVPSSEEKQEILPNPEIKEPEILEETNDVVETPMEGWEGSQVETPVQSPVDNGGPIVSLREYLFSNGDAPAFYVGQGNYTQQMPLIPYETFDAEDIISRLAIADGSEQQSDTNGDGAVDKITYMTQTAGWGKVDRNYDGVADYYIVMESNYSNTVDLQVEWSDGDYNGTVDEVKIHVGNPEDLVYNSFSAQYIYADYQVLDYDTGAVDYTNAGRIQIIQMVTKPRDSELEEQQFFRDYNGDGYVDMMQVRRFYDTDNDGVKESMKISSDRDMDGIFEDEYAYDGTIFDDSLIYDF